MKRTDRPAQPEKTPVADPLSVLDLMTSGLLDHYACDKQGYDPYDTSSNRKPDIWRAKRKRA